MMRSPMLAPPERSIGSAHLRFAVGGVEYAVPLQDVRSVEPLPPLTPLPFAPAWLVGLGAAGGQILSAVDLGTLLAAPPLGPARYLIVLGQRGTVVGLPVESVLGVDRLDGVESGRLDAAGCADGIAGIWCRGDAPVTLLDVAGLFQLLKEKGENPL